MIEIERRGVTRFKEVGGSCCVVYDRELRFGDDYPPIRRV